MGNGHEPDRHHRGRAGLCFRRRRTRELRNHRHSRRAFSRNRFEALEPVRQGVHRCFGSIAPGVARGLKLRHDHGSNYMSGDFQSEIKCLGIEASPSFVREPGRAMASPSKLHPNLEGELALGADVQNHRGTARRASSHSPCATMKSWLSRGMDTKTPARVRESKPCHQLRLTRRSQPPYPWPPEQAQPGVSKPCRTTLKCAKSPLDYARPAVLLRMETLARNEE